MCFQVDNLLKTGLARAEIEIVDLNDNLPEFEVDFYNISIVENLPNGFSVLQIIATDQDQGDNADFSYQLNDQTGAFSLDARTGWLTVSFQHGKVRFSLTFGLISGPKSNDTGSGTTFGHRYESVRQRKSS